MKINIKKIDTPEFEKGCKLCDAILRSSFGMNSAYIVGGCIRDIVRAELGQTEYPQIHDVDIATNMSMDILTRNFKTASNNGEAHGTMLVFMGNIPFEVTQFRTDGTYSDGRHPDSVKFAQTFDEDVRRRDFTINAMGMDGTGKIIDPVNGIDDIRNKVIRAVGVPRDRFREDALRIIRGIRFAINFEYEIEENTFAAMKEMAYNLSIISPERIRAEILKLDKRNGNFVKFMNMLDEIGAMEYLRPFKSINIDKMLSDASLVSDFTDDNIFPFILLYSTDVRFTTHQLTCTTDDLRKYKWLKQYMQFMSMKSEDVTWTTLIELYTGDYQLLFKMYRFIPDWEKREGLAKYLIENPIDKKAISKSIQDSGINPGPEYGIALKKAIESAYKQKISELLDKQL